MLLSSDIHMSKSSKSEAPQQERPDTLRRRAVSADSDKRCAVAAHPEAPIGVLRTLVGDDDPTVRKAVASNPNMPLELLWELAEEFPKTVAENPALWLQVAADPGAISDAPIETLIVLMGREQVPELWLQWGSDHYSFRVRTAVAENPSAPPNMLQKLAGDDDKDVRKAVAGNASSWIQTLEQLAEHKYFYDYDVREAVASNPSTPSQVLEHLASDEHPRVRRAIAVNPKTPPEALEPLVRDKHHEVREAAVTNPSTSKEVLKLLHKAGADKKLRHVGCAAESLTEAEREQLLACGPYGRRLLAAHAGTPPATLKRLASDADKAVRETVAKHPATPLEALQALATDSKWRVRAAVAENPSTPVKVIDQLLADNDPFVHQAAQRRLVR